MSNPVIQIEGLSKRYTIGKHVDKSDGLRHALEYAVRSPVKWLRSNFRARDTSLEEFWALKDVSFAIEQGETVGIIGRNGAGKSTLLKILSRVTEPTQGRIRMRGRVASLLEVGTGFHPELTGRENIFLNGAVLGMARTETKRKFDEIVAFAGIEKFIDTPVKRYSSGMYVRLAFAVAAHLEPEILIVDEVLAVGDSDFQKKCIEKMEDVSQRQGRTLLIVSHQMPVIQNLCSRCILLQDGRLHSEGKTDSVVNKYLSKAISMADMKLSERKDRQGHGNARFNAVEMLDHNGKPLGEAASGKFVIVRISFSIRDSVLLRNCRVSIGIIRNSRPYFVLSTDLVDKEPLHVSRSGFIDFEIPELPLSGGDYQLSCYFEGDGMTQDWVDDAARIEIVDGDFFGTGKLYHPGWQGNSVLVRHSWRIGHNDPINAEDAVSGASAT